MINRYRFDHLPNENHTQYKLSRIGVELLARNDAALLVVNAVAYYLIPLKSHQFDYATLYFYIILLFKNY